MITRVLTIAAAALIATTALPAMAQHHRGQQEHMLRMHQAQAQLEQRMRQMHHQQRSWDEVRGRGSWGDHRSYHRGWGRHHTPDWVGPAIGLGLGALALGAATASPYYYAPQCDYWGAQYWNGYQWTRQWLGRGPCR